MWGQNYSCVFRDIVAIDAGIASRNPEGESHRRSKSENFRAHGMEVLATVDVGGGNILVQRRQLGSDLFAQLLLYLWMLTKKIYSPDLDRRKEKSVIFSISGAVSKVRREGKEPSKTL